MFFTCLYKNHGNMFMKEKLLDTDFDKNAFKKRKNYLDNNMMLVTAQNTFFMT